MGYSAEFWSKKFALDFDLKNLKESEGHGGVEGSKGGVQSLYRMLFSLWFLLPVKGRGKLTVCVGEEFLSADAKVIVEIHGYVCGGILAVFCVLSIPSLHEAELQVLSALKGR